MPLNPLVESFYPQSVNDDAMAQPPCESVLLNPLADTFSPRHSLGEEPTIRYDADYCPGWILWRNGQGDWKGFKRLISL